MRGSRFKRIISFFLLASLSVSSFLVHAQSAAEGATLFKQKCTSCHAINQQVVGPALKGVNDRHSESFLLKWIKNSQALIASGDAEAKKLFEDNNQVAMTPFPELSDDNIKSILAYIKEEGDKPANTASASGGSGGNTSAEGGGTSDFMLIGLIAVIVIAFIVVLVLNRVVHTLERLLLKEQGLSIAKPETADKSSLKVRLGSQLTALKKLAKNKKFVFFAIILLMIFLGSISWMGLWNTGVDTGYQPAQPIKFSHQLHVGINKISCRYCHSGAYKSRNASIPSLNICMNCHNYVQAREKNNGEISPEIQKIYDALDYDPNTKVYGPNQRPIEWVRVHYLPSFAYFNHSQHVSVAGVKCQRCHGPIQDMQEVYQYAPLTMGWCINCHRATAVNSKGNPYYDKLLIAMHDKIKRGEKVTAAVLGGLDCSKCHY